MIWIYDRHRDGTMNERMDTYRAGALGARDEMRVQLQWRKLA
jgi:hypothetical protein